MEYLKLNAKKIGLFLDMGTIYVMFFIAFYLDSTVFSSHSFLAGSAIYYKTRLYVFTSWTLSLVLFSQYQTRRGPGFLQDIWSVGRVNVVATAACVGMVFFYKTSNFSRAFILLYLVCITIAMIVNRYVIRFVLYIFRSIGWDYRTRLIVGTGFLASEYQREMTHYKRYGFKTVGYVADSESGASLPYLGGIDELGAILSQNTIDGVVIALPITDARVEAIIDACETQGVSVEILLDGLSSRIAHSKVVHGVEVSRLVLYGIPHTSGALLMKRLTDILISFICLILLSPVLVATAIAIKLDDGGPVFFSQKRVGLHKRSFHMYKFRSMRVDAERVKKELMHLNEMSGPVFKIKNDPRVTRVGRFIRKTSLDELPQLFNVLLGDMSLVGPRPPLPAEVAKYENVHRRRLSVKPGITCLWQVSGRNDVDFETWMNLDLTYIDTWTYFNDWKILFKTIPAVLKGSGAQ